MIWLRRRSLASPSPRTGGASCPSDDHTLKGLGRGDQLLNHDAEVRLQRAPRARPARPCDDVLRVVLVTAISMFPSSCAGIWDRATNALCFQGRLSTLEGTRITCLRLPKPRLSERFADRGRAAQQLAIPAWSVHFRTWDVAPVSRRSRTHHSDRSSGVRVRTPCGRSLALALRCRREQRSCFRLAPRAILQCRGGTDGVWLEGRGGLRCGCPQNTFT